MNKKDDSPSDGRTRHYRGLLVWQASMGPAKAIYCETESLPQKEVYGLQAQARRAAVSIPSNIAEGSTTATSTNLGPLPAAPCWSYKPQFANR